MNYANLLDIFTLKQLEEYRGQDAKDIQRELIEPNMEKINEVTGQENDATFWAYLVQYYYLKN